MTRNNLFGQTFRLHFIDFLMAQYGTINRDVISGYFGLSTQQASLDLNAYIAIAPDNLKYDTSAKTYRRTAAFMRVWP
jgi:hypothetical protein